MFLPEAFAVRIERQGPVRRLIPTGELDIATTPQLRDRFETVFSDGDVEMIVIDLTELAFMDSTGLRLLLEMHSVCEHVDRLRIIAEAAPVNRILNLSGVRPLLPMISKSADPLAPLAAPTRTGGGSPLRRSASAR